MARQPFRLPDPARTRSQENILGIPLPHRAGLKKSAIKADQERTRGLSCSCLLSVTPLTHSPLSVSPFLAPIAGETVLSAVANGPVDSDSGSSFSSDLADALALLRDEFPGRSDFAITSMDCLLLLSKQLLESQLQGFDIAVLLFLMGHFHHKRSYVPFRANDIAFMLDRNDSQVRRSTSKLKKLGWILSDHRGDLMLNTDLLRSANPKYRAIGFRLARERFVSRR